MILGGHDNTFNPYAEFATREELALVDEKVNDIRRESASMAAAIQGLTKAVEKISMNIEDLITKKSVDAKIHAFMIKCSCVAGTIMVTILTAHWSGIIKIIGKWVNG